MNNENENENRVIESNKNVQSKKMSDYKFSQLESKLNIINKLSNEIVCIITDVDVDNFQSVLSLIKCLITTTNLCSTMYYSFNKLKRMFKDHSKSKFRLDNKKVEEETNEEVEKDLNSEYSISLKSNNKRSTYIQKKSLSQNMRNSISSIRNRRKKQNDKSDYLQLK